MAGAIESILSTERTRRRAEDEGAVKLLVVAAVEICASAHDLPLLESTIALLAKRRAQFPQAISKMVDAAVALLETLGEEEAASLVDTLLVVCEGKIFVEVPRARLTRRRALAKEAAGDVKGAAEEIQDVQVETLGSMEKDEKLDFILEQMRLCLEAGDWLRVLIISRKIHRKVFANNAFQDQKLRYHNLLMAYHLHEANYLHVARALLAVYNTPVIADDPDKKWADILAKAAVFIVLAKQAPDQQDLLHRIKRERNLGDIPEIYDLVAAFTTQEIMAWPEIEEKFSPALHALEGGLFDSATEEGAARMADLRTRVIEHNIRVISKYYTRISLDRLGSLLTLDVADAESQLCDMVVEKAIWAKIDRLAGVVSFVKPATADQLLNDWSSDVASLISIVEKCNQNLEKETMMHKLK